MTNSIRNTKTFCRTLKMYTVYPFDIFFFMLLELRAVTYILTAVMFTKTRPVLVLKCL